MLIDTTQLALERAMSGASLRQEALAANLANADTPGYQRVDVDFHTALRAAMSGGASAVSAVAPTTTVDRSAGAMRADGSTVDVDSEAAKLAANGIEYETLATAAKARMDILRSAMGIA